MPKMSEMRQFVMNLYPDRIWWHEKVAHMRTCQVVAIYKKYKDKDKDKEPEGYHQIDIFEYLAGQSQNHTEVKV